MYVGVARQKCEFLRGRIDHPTTGRVQLLGPVADDVIRLLAMLRQLVPMDTPDVRLNPNTIRAKRYVAELQGGVATLKAEGWTFTTDAVRRRLLRMVDTAILVLDELELRAR